MSSAAMPFTLQTYALERLQDGRPVTLELVSDEAATALGVACAAMEPWKRYGIAADRLAAGFAARDRGGYRYQVLVDGDLAGVLMILSPWLIGPYLQFIAVLPAMQGVGVGQCAMAWFEGQARAARHRNIWLCVTGFNDGAHSFYRSLGWEDAAMLPGLIVDDFDETLMRKRLVYRSDSP